MTPQRPLPPPPAELAALSEHLLPEELLALLRAHAGTTIWLPRTLNQGSVLVRAVGRPAAERLVAACGPGKLQVPLARHWRVLVALAEGKSAPKIARELGITEKAVRDHKRAARRHEGSRPAARLHQPDLFEPA